MTDKQEEIQRRRSHIYDGLVEMMKKAEPDSPRATTKDILDFLVSWGVVIEVGGELPKNLAFPNGLVLSSHVVKTIMDSAVESLFKGE